MISPDEYIEQVSLKKAVQDYDCLSSSYIEGNIEKVINQLVEELGLSEDLAFAVLMRNEWSVAKTIQTFAGDPEYV